MHPQQPKFKLNRNIILAGIISATFPVAGYCIPAGHLDFVIGNVEAVAVDGTRRPLSKGSEISPGDAIHTATGARAQVRFVDGGYVSLQPNTQFRVDEFNYKNKADSEEKGFFSLLKGGLRAITGAIGHSNRDAYQVKTPSATIGIRGTGYKAEIREDGLLVSVGEGAVFLSNNMGAVLVTAGNGAFVASANTAPTPTTEQPNTPPASLPTQGSTSSSTPPVIPPAPPSMKSGNNYAVSGAFTLSQGNGIDSTANPTEAIFNDNSQLVKIYDSSSGSGRALASATVSFAATDGIIGWGRWDGDSDSTNVETGTSTVSGTYHYVVGIPTAVMPTSGSASYGLMGYTTPTASDGSTGWSVSNANLTVTFGGTNSIAMNMTVANTVDNYTVNGTLTGTGTSFSGTPGVTGGGGSASASVNGFFAGDNASRAGLAYEITDSTVISGVATYAKN